jgi:hypothetical protein
MCFSPTASFTAGVALATVGVATLKKTKSHREIPYALIPFFFGLQQIIEGFVWLSFGWSPSTRETFSVIYSLFALCLWPSFVPVAILLLERQVLRQKILMVISLFGIGVAAFLLYRIYFHHPTAFILNQCVHYDVVTPYSNLLWAMYVLIVVGAGVVSSYRTVKVFGVVLLGSLLFALREYKENAISVWCFFSALLSVVVYWHFARPHYPEKIIKSLKKIKI